MIFLQTADTTYSGLLVPGMYVSVAVWAEPCPRFRRSLVMDLLEITSVTATGFRGERCCFPWSLPPKDFRIGQPVEFLREHVWSVEHPERAKSFIRFQTQAWLKLNTK